MITDDQKDIASRILTGWRGGVVSKGRKNGRTTRALQLFLKSEGYDLKADGDFGKNTKAALKDWQAKNGLKADGAAGNQTFTRIREKITPIPKLRPEPPVAEVMPPPLPMAESGPDPVAPGLQQPATDPEFMANMARGPIPEQPPPRFDEEPMAPMPPPAMAGSPMPAGPPPGNDAMAQALMSGGPPQPRPMGMDDPDQNLGPGDPMFNPMGEAQAMAARSNTVRQFEEPWAGMSPQDQAFFDAGEGARQGAFEGDTARMRTMAGALARGPAFGGEAAGEKPALDKLKAALLRRLVPQVVSGQ